MKVVRAVSMSPESIEIAYMDDTSDLRGEMGSVYQVHTICVRTDDPELDEEVERLETAVSAFLNRAVMRWATSAPVDVADAFEHELRQRYAPDDDDEEDEVPRR